MSAIRSFAFTRTPTRIADGRYSSPVCHANDAGGLEATGTAIDFKGTCDLVVGNQKVSGNSLRVRRNWLLYHGTFLLSMDLSLIDRLLHHPPREPDYRSQRRHGQFVANLNLDRAVVAEQLRIQWNAYNKAVNLPMDATRKIAQEKYWNATWNHQR